MQTWQELAADLKFKQGKSWTETARAIMPYFPDRTEHQVYEMVRGSLRCKEQYKTRGNVTFEDKKEPTEADIDAYYELMKQTNDAALKMESKQTKATICIDDERPVGIAFWGDLHTGGKGIEYDQIDTDIELMAETDGLYIVGMGDYKDNASALVHPSSTQENISPSDLQDKIVQRMFEKLKARMLVILRGCHEDWDKRNANKDFVQTLCDITGAVNLWHGGIINLTVGHVEYRIGARHRYKFESSLNTTNAQRNFMNDYGHCDIVAVAHKHYAEFQHSKKMGEETIFLRSGSYKRYDEFGQKLAGYEGIYGVPVVILFPDKREMLPIRDLDRAVELLSVLRGK